MASATQTVQSVQTILRYTYGLVPIIAGLDKFTNLLTDWKHYLSPAISRMLPFSPGVFMSVVGVIEIIAGVLVLVRPRIGAYVVMAWLVCIALNLLMAGYYDIAVRDLVMAVGAYCLARLSETQSLMQGKASLQ
jgi:uncharacterized membrane protein YphA (DoxX/SURF4 family)